MNYGRALKIARVSRGMSQKELAALVHIDSSYISFIENGERIPGVSILENLANVLNVPLYLLVLLASKQQDLEGLTNDEYDRLGGRLLRVLVDP